MINRPHGRLKLGRLFSRSKFITTPVCHRQFSMNSLCIDKIFCVSQDTEQLPLHTFTRSETPALTMERSSRQKFASCETRTNRFLLF